MADEYSEINCAVSSILVQCSGKGVPGLLSTFRVRFPLGRPDWNFESWVRGIAQKAEIGWKGKSVRGPCNNNNNACLGSIVVVLKCGGILGQQA